MNKHVRRTRRGLKTKKIQSTASRHARPILVVFRSGHHIYAQIIERGPSGNLIMVSSSTVDKELRSSLKGTKVEKAKMVGELLAIRAKAKNIDKIAFDRAGYKFHGRVKALAEAAREAGLDF